jgi:hypothetical protein
VSGRIIDTTNPCPEHPDSPSSNVDPSVSVTRSKQEIAIAGICGIAVVMLILAVDLYLALKYLR